jgi:hypothetical protein
MLPLVSVLNQWQEWQVAAANNLTGAQLPPRVSVLFVVGVFI